VPKSYEDEIRDLLRGMDRFPGEQPPRRPRRSMPPIGLSRLDPQRIMGGALILMLFAWLLRGPWIGGYPLLAVAAGYISLVSIALFVVALVMMIRGGAFSGGAFGGRPREVRWRGQVVQMPRRGGPVAAMRRWFRRLQRGPNRPRGRDSFQW
jgi:hypothetical protein